jgi:deoxyribodipyrimidine photo-lyase
LPPLPAGVIVPPALAAELPALASYAVANPRLPAGGESAAAARLEQFIAQLEHYAAARDELSATATSHLSVDLHFGTLSVRRAYRTVAAAGQGSPVRTAAAEIFCRQLVWRDFAHHLLWEDRELLERPFQRGFEGFPWLEDAAALSAWQEGRTGYPVVDAAARQLLAEGYVHNRARMIAASFLCKHLLLHWRHGYDHYMRWLVDGNWANNSMGWQWSAGCGCDAQPWFRVFNPLLQGEKHDPEGRYVRRWLPELGRLPDRYVHRPWEAPTDVLRSAGVRLGDSYPRPIVDHAAARARFLRVAKGHLKGGEAKALELPLGDGA